MRTTFVNVLLEHVKNNKNIELITGDLGFGVLKEYQEKYPNQFTNGGIAEQNMLSVAGGMAALGKKVIVYSIGNFPTFRALEQVRNDICYYNHDVKIICIGGGYTYGSLGMSHHATEDIGVLRPLPNMTIFTPSDKTETIAVVNKMLELNTPCYLRLERDSQNDYHKEVKDIFIPQVVNVVNSKIAIFTYGTIVEEAYDLCKQYGIDLYTCPCLKPISEKAYKSTISKYDYVISLEEHSIIGGLGDILGSIIATNGINTRLRKIGINDFFTCVVGKQSYMRKTSKIDKEEIKRVIKEIL